MDEKGYTKAELSRATGITDSTLSRWAAGRNEPTIRELRKLAPHLDVRLGDLIVRAGLASPAELGMKGAPPPPRAPLPPILQKIVSILLSPKNTPSRKASLLAAVSRTVEMWEEIGEAPREPRMRKRT
jgi:transcriptional regulator with XRE-family HTH domain